MNRLFPGIFKDKGKLLTLNLAPGKTVYDERLWTEKGKEFRVWDPNKSKLCSAIKKGMKDSYLKENSVCLYLGAASGTTVSHVSDIVKDGFVFALDVAFQVVRDLVFVAEDRPNIAPILADANHPETFADRICQVDWLFQDIAQKNQVPIFVKNVEAFLKPKGIALLAIKARSIDVTKSPREIFINVSKEIPFEIIEKIQLDPFQKDHMLFVVRK